VLDRPFASFNGVVENWISKRAGSRCRCRSSPRTPVELDFKQVELAKWPGQTPVPPLRRAINARSVLLISTGCRTAPGGDTGGCCPDNRHCARLRP